LHNAKSFHQLSAGTFSDDALAALADEITTTGLECEKLPDSSESCR
jgi:hypothetical protein